MRNVRAVALVLLAGMLAAACGARLPSSERRQAAAAILNAGSGSVGNNTGVPGTSTGPVAPGTGPGTGGNRPATGPVTGGNGPTTTGQQGNQNGGSSQGGKQGSSCPTGGTDVGLASN